MSDHPDDDLILGLYARFGLAYYQSECLHRELCFTYACSGLPSPDMITRPRVEEQLAHAFTLTLGDVAVRLKGVLPAEMTHQIQEAVDVRNFLAHHFWFERAHQMFAVGDVRRLIAELNEYAAMFDQIDSRVSEWSEPKRRELGLTEEVLQFSLRRIVAGESDEPLPDKQTVRELGKKLGSRQRLIRVWEFTLEDGLKPLIFEFVDGSLATVRCRAGLDQVQGSRSDLDGAPSRQAASPSRYTAASEALRTVELRINARQWCGVVGKARPAKADFQMGRSDVQGAPDLARTTRHTWLREAMHRAAQPDVNSARGGRGAASF